jgi:hypothetical protein
MPHMIYSLQSVAKHHAQHAQVNKVNVQAVYKQRVVYCIYTGILVVNLALPAIMMIASLYARSVPIHA